MATFVFAMPIIPGKEGVDRDNIQRMATLGPELGAYVAARRGQGVTREAVWHQSTPDGILAIVLIEGDDIRWSLGEMASSDDAFSQSFRAQVKEVHGVDLANDPRPSVELIGDVSF